MPTCTTTIYFCAAHRVPGQSGKCENIHGHNFRAEITVAADSLDNVGRVIDFHDVQRIIGGWVNEHWDHSFLYWKNDNRLAWLLKQESWTSSFQMDMKPTAENMAAYLLVVCQQLLPVRTSRVRLWENHLSFADAIPASFADITP